MTKSKIPEHAKVAFEGKMYTIYQWEQEMFDGSTQIFERMQRPDTVKIIPVLDNGNLLIQKERQPDRPPFIDFPGGMIDEGEMPKDAAARELLEETGFTAKKFVKWFEYSPARNINWSMYIYIARGLKKSKEQMLDPGEIVEPFEISFEEMLSIPDDEKYLEFRAGGPFTEMLLRAKYIPEKRKELYDLLYSS